MTDGTAPMIRVLLVDDHAMVRRGLRGFLELLDDIEIVGEGSNGREALELARELQPDVILMDLVMPEVDGIGAIGAIKREMEAVEIVALTSFVEEAKVTAALEAGASGFILKDADADDVAGAIRTAFAGEVSLDPAVAGLLARRVRERAAVASSKSEPLTDREKEVLRLVAAGLANKGIASELGITERTARTHVSNILGKLNLSSRTQAALYARDHWLDEEASSGGRR